jgi:D-alanyl-D-alanine carboxypeptidase/D-alanyl-D-alanine-endopeptidase (penicillin-binding protein 4)
MPWTAAERERARAVLAATFTSPVLAGAGLVVLGADGETLFARRASVPMTPASSLKLLVAATSLDVLGPQRRFETTFDALEAPDVDGTLQGPLWLVGSGDPLLRSDDLRGGVGALARAGLRRVSGGLIVDASTFSGPEQNPNWDPADLTYDYAAGTSAISLDGNVAEFRVTPGDVGESARVEVRPQNADVAFSGTIATAPAGDDTDVHIVRPQPVVAGSSGRNDFEVSGQIAAGEAQSFYEPVIGIAEFVGGAAAAMLLDRGIALDGGIGEGHAPFAVRPLWTHRSLPVAALLREMLVYSDNHTAEQLLRIVGFELGHAGTEHYGIRAEREYLARTGIPSHGMFVVDGSGLSPKDAIAPIVLARVLRSALSAPTRDAFLRALPLVGREGTVRHHDLTVALGRVRAKSGHIEGVNALAGTVQTARHGRVTFAFIVNGPYAEAGAVTAQTDAALDALSRF